MGAYVSLVVQPSAAAQLETAEGPGHACCGTISAPTGADIPHPRAETHSLEVADGKRSSSPWLYRTRLLLPTSSVPGWGRARAGVGAASQPLRQPPPPAPTQASLQHRQCNRNVSALPVASPPRNFGLKLG